eukprot:COSAG01_NODE_4422_length_5037_cov_79.147226_5_plen_136_part_00
MYTSGEIGVYCESGQQPRICAAAVDPVFLTPSSVFLTPSLGRLLRSQRLAASQPAGAQLRASEWPDALPGHHNRGLFQTRMICADPRLLAGAQIRGCCWPGRRSAAAGLAAAGACDHAMQQLIRCACIACRRITT